MIDKNLEKIIKFFKEIKCPVEFVLKKNSNDALFQQYAVIYGGEDIMFSDKKNKKFDFEEKMGFDLSAYYTSYFNKERFLKRLERDGYILCKI